MNNHWHTNFPLSQEGVVSFRYVILPHNYAYDPVAANRFGVEQSQPLIAVPAKPDTPPEQPFTISGSDKIYATLIKAAGNGEPAKVRLRSISAKDETVQIVWKKLRPSDVYINGEKAGNSITVPAMGFVTLELVQ